MTDRSVLRWRFGGTGGESLQECRDCGLSVSADGESRPASRWITYDRSLRATDGSEPAHRAPVEAIELAKTRDDSLVASTCSKSPSRRRGSKTLPSNRAWIRRLAGARRGVVSKAAARNPGTGVVEAVVSGRTAPAVLACADEVDRIVRWTHGRTGLDRVAVGSVAEHVVPEAPVPVLTARPTNWP